MEMSKAGVLTQQFYAWEQRGRGWLTASYPVDIEPSFHPFSRHAVRASFVPDDSKHHTLVSWIASKLQPKRTIMPEYDPYTDIPPVEAFPFFCEDEGNAYKIIFPKEQKLSVSDIEPLLLMLSYTQYPLSFEIIATGTTISLQFLARGSDIQHLCAQIQAYFPMAVISEHTEGIRTILREHTQTCVADFGIHEEFMRPILMADEADHDPYTGLFGVLESIGANEQATIQILFKGVANPWSGSILRSVMDSKGDSFFADAPEMVKLAQAKVSAPLFGVCIRVAGQGATDRRAVEIVTNVGTTLMRLTKSNSNSLMLLSQHSYPLQDLIDDMYLRLSHRLGMLLNSRELATLLHFPTPEVASSKLERDTKKTKSAPESTHGHPLVLGINTHHGETVQVSVPASLRLRHTHIIGATGTGKSTLLLSMIAQDMQQGNGCAILDPHGDLIETILAHVPKDRINDVVLIDPADAKFPVGFNILSAHSEIEKDILSSDLVASFKRLSTSWGDQMNSVFANAILAFLESSQGGTLLDLRRFLIEKPFRDAYLKTLPDPHIVYYWEHEYPLLKSSSIGSILTRLDTFLRPKLIRNMVGQKKGLDFERILDTKKILLVKLSQGLIGEENSFLLGTFFVSKMYQAAMARQAKNKADRSDFFLYIDEFQNFITPSMSHILSGARKYHLGLILAHQDMQQLQKEDTELASSVVVNAGTRICFRLGDTDAKRFAGGFSYFDALDLENLHTGEAIARIEQPNFDFNLSTIPLPDISAEEATATTNAVVARSRETYGTPKENVEAGLHQQPPPRVVTEQVKEPEPISVSVPQAPPPVQVEQPKEELDILEETKRAVAKQKSQTRHRYLQTLIKRMAESRGYKAMLESTVPGGRVDVSLEKDGKRIACEISVTTPDTWEIHNVEKCLNAGYVEVIVCSDDIKHLQKIREQVENRLSPDQQTIVLTLQPDDVIQYFDRQIVAESSKEVVIKGYRIKVEYDDSTMEEMQRKKESVVKTVARSRKK